jgi:ribulose 1,5-bisphosphate synthetase/thiazole synthase
MPNNIGGVLNGGGIFFSNVVLQKSKKETMY